MPYIGAIEDYSHTNENMYHANGFDANDMEVILIINLISEVIFH